MNEKVLMTAGRMKEKAPVNARSGGFLSIHQVHDGQLRLSAKEYVNRFAEDAEFEQLKKIVEARRKKIPAFSFWICRKCEWVIRARGDKEEGGTCLKCNFQRDLEGGFMRKMDEGEIAAYQKKEGEENARIGEREEAARLFEVNQGRQKAGLPPFTAEQFAESIRMDLQRKREWEKQEAERQAEWEKKKEAMAHKGEIQPKVKA